MSTIHFLNVYEGDCNIIQHDSGHVTVIDVSNADDHVDTAAETAVKASAGRKAVRERNFVPNGKINYGQKHLPDNPIDYLKKYNVTNIFRFIVTHPDMDHLDGIKDFFGSFDITNFWDTDNEKENGDILGGGYNIEDWDFYKSLRDGTNTDYARRTYLSGSKANYFVGDDLQVIAPTAVLIADAIARDDYNDSSMVLLYTPPKTGGGTWKILFAGDSHNRTWEYILNKPELKALVSNVDVLLAPHHGRDSDRSYDFLKALKPKITLFGNAGCEHLAYDCYPKTRITNNEAGYVVMDISPDLISFYVKNEEFAVNFCHKRNWGSPVKNAKFDGFSVGVLKA